MMALDTLKNLPDSVASMTLDSVGMSNGHTGSAIIPTHPFDPLSSTEIERAVAAVRKQKGDALFFNAVTLQEPRKKEMLAWLDDASKAPKPRRTADVVATGKESKVFDGLVVLYDAADGGADELVRWVATDGVQPLITMEDLKVVEGVCRKDPKVIEQCDILGIPPEDMHKVYCDPWTIGYDERYGNKIRLQQALMYYRPHVDDSQYTYPLDFCPIYDADQEKIVDIDVPKVRRPLNKAPAINYHAQAIEKGTNPGPFTASSMLDSPGIQMTEGAATDGHTNGRIKSISRTDAATLTHLSKSSQPSGFRTDIKPLNITQPEGVSFSLRGRELHWQNWNLHIGFNYREGIVLNNISIYDGVQARHRPVFYRLSLAEMVVPYGNPEHPHQRKHAFDLGEYGGGYMTNSLALGCDCKGAIRYLDADFVNRAGKAETIENAICIHEEDAGILFKHTDFRDNSTTVTRARKLVISQVFTAANYEYCIYWTLHQDGTVQLEIKLTGILNTYACTPDEDLQGYGTQVYPGVNAHNHQHLFGLRIDPQIDGQANSIMQVDATAVDAPVGDPSNRYGNAFFAKKTRYETVQEGVADYNGDTSRSWDMCNENVLNPFSGKPVAYKLVSREVPKLLPKEGSLVWKRAGFARHAVHVTRYNDAQIHPAGRHVPQTSGDPSSSSSSNTDLPAWIAADPSANIANTDVVLWHTFGLTHFAAPEDYPVMPAEPMMVLLRPRNFFDRNPALDVRPSFSSWPSQVAGGGGAFKGGVGKSVAV